MSLTTYLNNTTVTQSAGYGDSDVATYLASVKGLPNQIASLDANGDVTIGEVPPLFINNYQIGNNGASTGVTYQIDHPVINGIQYEIISGTAKPYLNHYLHRDFVNGEFYNYFSPSNLRAIRYQLPQAGNWSIFCQLMRVI